VGLLSGKSEENMTDSDKAPFDANMSPREIRRRLGLNQEEFWTKIGVTQSGGSRYESGREMPRPVRELFRLVYVEGVDLSRIGREDLQVIDYLRARHPDLYQRLLQAVRASGDAALSK
jgi:transcriptional regulator with XRE-family HTH domain